MLLPRSTRECTAFVYVLDSKGNKWPKGTAFLVAQEILNTDYSWISLVTARHVIEKVRQKTDDHLVHLRINNKDKEHADWVTIPIDEWSFHPQDDAPGVGYDWLQPIDRQRYDVAVADCPAGVYTDSDMIGISQRLFATDSQISAEQVGIGDEIGITGLYNQHHKTNRNIPIVRSGMIAAMPEELVATEIGPMHAYLIETRSTGGLSGSPVFWLSGWLRPSETDDHRLRPIKRLLLGLVQGHYNSLEYKEELNDGIATVVPMSTIMVTLNQGAIMTKRKPIEQELRKKVGGPVSDAADDGVAPIEPDRVSLAGVAPEDALRALLRTPPHGQTQDPA